MKTIFVTSDILTNYPLEVSVLASLFNFFKENDKYGDFCKKKDILLLFEKLMNGVRTDIVGSNTGDSLEDLINFSNILEFEKQLLELFLKLENYYGSRLLLEMEVSTSQAEYMQKKFKSAILYFNLSIKKDLL